MNKDFTPNGIINRFNTRFAEYLSGDAHLKDPPCPLFNDDGAFYPSNWMSGQDPRAIFMESEGLFEHLMDNALEVWVDSDERTYGVLWSGCHYHDDQSYIIINVIINDDRTIRSDTYLISWYKSRGRTEVFNKNGAPITLIEYSELLRLLDDARIFDMI